MASFTRKDFGNWGSVMVIEADGIEQYWALIQVGGKDDQGEYEFVLDGPAQGEKAYL